MQVAEVGLVVDASVVVDWVAPGSDPDSAAMAVLAKASRGTSDLVAPRLLLEEVANALITGIRRGRWSGADADASFALLQSLPVRLSDGAMDLERAWELSRRHDQHPIYDMIYVALAERTGRSLVTADAALRQRLARLTFVVGPEDVASAPTAAGATEESE
jgi:predicted nucleic acid-binding protein